MLKPVDEELIERYIRFRDEMTLEQLVEVDRLLQNSAEARELADWFKQFYQTLDKMNPTGTQLPTTLRLVPLTAKQQEIKQANTAILFAAKSTEKREQERERQHVVSYHHEEHRIVLRVSRLKGGKYIEFNLIAPLLSDTLQVELEIPKIDKIFSLKKGKNRLKSDAFPDPEAINWRALDIILHTQ